MRFLYWPPWQPTGYRNLRMFDRDGYNIGRLVWVVCDICRVGSINKISINPDRHRQGLGRRLVRRALADGPGYTWQTTSQSSGARKFFPALEEELGVALTEFGGVCGHLASPRPSATGLPRRAADLVPCWNAACEGRALACGPHPALQVRAEGLGAEELESGK